MGDANPIRTLRDYTKPSHEGYRNTIELLVGNNVVSIRSDTIRLVKNGCSFHGFRSKDPNQLLKDFLKLVDSLDLDRSITTWEDHTTRFLAQFFPPGRTAKLHNDILMLQQHHGESLSEVWTRFKDLLQKVPHHGINLWLQVQIFYDLNDALKKTIDYTVEGRLRKLSAEEAWATIEKLAQYEDEGTDLFSGPQWGNIFCVNEPIYRELAREFFNSFEFKAAACRLYTERRSKDNATLNGLSRAETVKAHHLLMEFWLTIRDGGFNVGNIRVTSIKDPRVKLAYRCIREERNHPHSHRDRYTLRRIARSFGLLTNEMRDALSIEPPPHVFKKKSLISMGVIMEL
nr:hypothetical protein [Tanacetum cinerariifolium]